MRIPCWSVRKIRNRSEENCKEMTHERKEPLDISDGSVFYSFLCLSISAMSVSRAISLEFRPVTFTLLNFSIPSR